MSNRISAARYARALFDVAQREADLSKVVAHREAHKEAFARDGARLPYTPYFVAAAVAAAKPPSTNGIPSTNTIWLLPKWIPYSCKVKRPEEGGCSYRIRNTSPAVIRIICWRAVMRYRRDG